MEICRPHSSNPNIRLILRKPQCSQHVRWAPGTVDNENLGRKKSKCNVQPACPEIVNNDEDDEKCR
ncbi:unnamed protein product [Soboliphyme baturini]|uniref:Uncharacterized protein n=1 Tax=Soboliphyme baturini TaxID=241478 RepID=A0A183J4Z2_9BILA|nr:unnamed protein product [Soboliphyme baturini]